MNRPAPAYTRAAGLPALLAQRIVIIDGAMGTMIQNADLTPEDFEGADSCNELLVRTRPDVIRKIHAAYYAAGADCVETNTFGANAVAAEDYHFGAYIVDLNVAAAQVARRAAERAERADHPSGTRATGVDLADTSPGSPHLN